jgi:hypothetical protein
MKPTAKQVGSDGNAASIFQEVPSSELIQDTTILIDVFRGFSHSGQVNAKIVT